ncbi:MAG: hypothetical protein IKG70_02330 [Lachnospiraceae bacterium]|nr:hypothetical protein [Lachnospiraceae bacterium]
MSGQYDDIIDLPRPVSRTRRHMTDVERAAQFAPFAALTGFGDMIDETSDDVNSFEGEIIKILI